MLGLSETQASAFSSTMKRSYQDRCVSHWIGDIDASNDSDSLSQTDNTLLQLISNLLIPTGVARDMTTDVIHVLSSGRE